MVVVRMLVSYMDSGRGVLRRRSLLAITTIALALVPAAAMAADSPAQHQYGSSLQQLSQSGTGGSVGGGSATGTVGSLPFTGFDVALLAAVAAGLVLAGFLLRRQRPDSSRS
ncbi:MAG: hypothetical protein QOI10_1490 [Solirubrobacterales bacterium]|jgi:hypothetical protein|nr:hypothetical protein [Solirubrobacterales bacterium]